MEAAVVPAKTVSVAETVFVYKAYMFVIRA